jgi:uncharacterized membrane protein
MAVLILIIIVDLLVIIALMYWGSKHDAHHSIRDPHSAQAIILLQEKYGISLERAGEIAEEAETMEEAEEAAEAEAEATAPDAGTTS